MKNQKTKALKLSKSAISTMLKVQQMIEQEEQCIKIMQQLNSVNGLLKSVKKELLICHLQATLDNVQSKDKTLSDLMSTFNLE